MIELIIQAIQFICGLLHISPEMLAAVSGAALAISEALSLIPVIKSNGIVQLIIGILKRLAGK